MTGSLSFNDQQVGEPDSDLAFTVPIPEDWTALQQGWGPPLARDRGGLPRMLRAASPDDRFVLTIDVDVLEAEADSEAAPLHARALRLLDAQMRRPERLEVQQVGPLMGVGMSMVEGYPLDLTRVHVAICEGGGRLVQITLHAPDKQPARRTQIWNRVTQYFCFSDHRRSTIDTALPVNDWWSRAQKFEQANQFAEAEAIIKANIPHLAFAYQTAYLYELRMHRLKGEGDLVGAAHAHDEARNWIYMYAGFATSGGEGAALSYERDKFMSALGPRP